MTELLFYHLTRRRLEQVLPELLEKTLQRGWRAVVKGGSEERIDALNGLLWTYGRASFLPHGVKADGFEDKQPIYLTTEYERPNKADVLFLVDGADAEDVSAFTRVCDLFDGNDEIAVQAARERWKKAKAAGHTLTYWQQSESGGWVKKAEG
ncbi:MAG TPA: DNA polymerase III subunit chi [Ferrovibrio sp.]|jgi:DNA polymerase-3 subunit chi|uniref:DNA polymerase III subunit chi n=1 Tax=Ferrovibrio sp. TaxID=1917215 RepID=UPI002ED127A5